MPNGQKRTDESPSANRLVAPAAYLKASLSYGRSPVTPDKTFLEADVGPRGFYPED